MTKNNTIWTRKMRQLREEICRNDNSGVFVDNLTEEDESDFVDFLEESHIPVLKLYRETCTFMDPQGPQNLLDGDPIYFDEDYDFVGYYITDDKTKRFLSEIARSDKIYPHPYRSETGSEYDNCKSVSGYSKFVATALLNFSKVGVVLDQDNLAPEMMGEFFPGYSNSNDTVSEEDKIMFDKVSMSLIRGMRIAKFRKNCFGRVMLETFFIESKDEADCDWVLKLVKNNGLGSGIEKIKSDCNYFNSKLKKELGLDYDAASPDNDLRRVVINPRFREMVKATE